MALKRVFAGFYTRYDGKPIFVVLTPLFLSAEICAIL